MAHQLQIDLTAQFPILDELIFFDHAGVAPISGPAAAALEAYARQAATRGYVGSGWQPRIRQVKQLAARLIGAESDDQIAFVANTSTGLNMVARGLDWHQGDQVVITSVEYPANRYPWEDLARFGVQMIQVEPHADGTIDVQDVCRAITERTRIVALSHVQYASGFRIDLKPISDAIHAAGGYLCVDAIQSVGVVPVNVQDQGIDFLAADGHKWLLAPEGCGIFYCRGDLLAKLHPALVGWMGMVDHTNFGNYQFAFAPTARRFEPGSYNVPGILALGASLELLLDVGVEAVWSRVDQLTERLCASLDAKGYRLCSPRLAHLHRSGIVVFEPPALAPTPAQIAAALGAERMVIVVREGRLRASPHFYNSDSQVDRLVEALP